MFFLDDRASFFFFLEKLFLNYLLAANKREEKFSRRINFGVETRTQAKKENFPYEYHAFQVFSRWKVSEGMLSTMIKFMFNSHAKRKLGHERKTP
jgi:hypothetical protein